MLASGSDIINPINIGMADNKIIINNFILRIKTVVACPLVIL